MTVEVFAMCHQLLWFDGMVQSSSVPDTRYHVVLGWEYSNCECPAFMYGNGLDVNGYCRHMELLDGERCHWYQLLDKGDLDAEGNCPVCHGPVTWRGVAV